VPLEFDSMNNMCKRAIEQCEEIIYSNKEFKISEILLELGISDNIKGP